MWTFRVWTIGIVSRVLLSFFNQFFAYRNEPLIISQITVQVHCVVRPEIVEVTIVVSLY